MTALNPSRLAPVFQTDLRFERLLDGFSPSFEFEPVGPLPESEFVDRLRRIRREAVVAGHDVILIHADSIGSYKVSNSYLRYVCDWAREGVLVIPTDDDKPLTLFSIFSSSVLLPPAGEAVLVEDIWQVGTWGRETYNRPGKTVDKVADAVAAFLEKSGLSSVQIGTIGDATSAGYWNGLKARLPKSSFVPAEPIVERMQKVRSPKEQAVVRAAAQLANIGIEAAYHVVRPGVTDFEIYAAFTYAQMARGGETGDGYQIGINRYGTHCGKPYGHIVRDGDLINLYISAKPPARPRRVSGSEEPSSEAADCSFAWPSRSATQARSARKLKSGSISAGGRSPESSRRSIR
ncbi:Xaa-Pro aminopeptidase [Neorhizobium galegae]|nr:Xaa-Pro aminopeptidase [Neorhizobium galegae]